MADYNQVLESEPKNISAKQSRAQILNQRKNHKAAIVDLTAALKAKNLPPQPNPSSGSIEPFLTMRSVRERKQNPIYLKQSGWPRLLRETMYYSERSTSN